MALPTIVAKNLSVSPLDLPDLGLTLPASGQVDLTERLFLSEITSSRDLYSEVDNGNVVLAVDGADLTLAETMNLAITVPNDTGWNLIIEDRDLTAPPGSPTIGDFYLVASPATGDWLGQENQLASWNGNSWVFRPPATGLAAWVRDESIVVAYDGAAWGPFGGDSFTGLDAFGAYDATGGQTFTGSAITVNLNVERIVSSATYTLANDEVTLTETNRYWVSCSASTEVTSGSRTQGQAWLEVDTGGGWVEIPGTRMGLYNRQTNHGATGGHSFPRDFAAGDKVRMRAVRTMGNGTLRMEVNASTLSFMKIG